jgi:TonB family protein
MDALQGKPINFLVELEPRGRAFWSTLGAALRPVALPREAELGPWRDVFVRQKMPWGRFLESIVLHAGAAALIWMVSIAWLRQQTILPRAAFDQSQLVTYSPQEYLPPLDTGASETPKDQAGDPVYAKQPILSVPPEADNHTQTIVVPPDLKLNHDVPLPNIVAMSTIAPAVPLDATHDSMNRSIALSTPVVAPAPEVDWARDRVVHSSMTSTIIAPPPEISSEQTRSLAEPSAAVVAPPPEITQASRTRVGEINMGTTTVVAPAPQLAVAPQHTLAVRGIGGPPGGSVQPVAPPPSVGAASGTASAGRLIALGIHPVAPTGPVPVPGGNRRGTFAAGPEGKVGASGTPRLTGSESAAKGSGSRGNGGGNGFGSKTNGSLPSGLHVGAANSNSVGLIERNGSGGSGDGDGEADPRLMASLSVPRTGANAKPLVPVANEKVTETDRQVFGDRRIYSMTLNMPNLNSATGSWVIRFAELKNASKEGELLAPVPTEKSDPAYPMELMRENVHGSVTLHAVIHSDGRVGDITVLSSPDDRLDPLAENALARWRFLPALKAGKPVPLEAIVVIPFRMRREF